MTADSDKAKARGKKPPRRKQGSAGASGKSRVVKAKQSSSVAKNTASKAKKAAGKEAGVKSEKVEKAGELAKNIWLAGLGAYGKAFDVATNAGDTSGSDNESFFDGLVERGQELEKQAREQISRPLPKPDLSKPKMAIEERIEKMRTYLGMGSGSSKDEEIENLKRKVASLERKLKAKTASGSKGTKGD